MYKNKNILITGGMGFLGSNLAHRMVNLGANVTLLDNLNPLYGGNPYNIFDISNKVNIVIGDIRNVETLKILIKKTDYIFHFAAQVSYIDSISMPDEDLDVNAWATLNLCEICRKHNPNAKIIFTSSRMVLGKIDGTVFNEQSPTNPLSLYGTHKLTSEKYLQMYYKDFGIRSTILRITNPYGPRQQMKHHKYSILGWFIRQAMEGKTIKVFGDGNQIRDYIYIDDMVEPMCVVAATKDSDGQIINLGSGTGTMFKDMVQTVVDIVGSGNIEFVPWPQNYERVETGNSIADISKLKRLSGYAPVFDLNSGIERTYTYYKKHLKHYTASTDLEKQALNIQKSITAKAI